ncbi:hypothetical protein [Dyella acidisoli]|uniref:hypothetical protein n=1 Tax=Dyella acidisoli TaxID=1867834 RepID=UPI0024E18790|nr:hypothetical protein [Dyella acidisoli]
MLTNGTVITTTTYDVQGRLLQTSTETGANRTTLQTTTYAYDGLGRLLSTTDPLSNVTSYVYTDSANTLAITQANGLTTTQVRTSAGQLLNRTQSASGQTSRITSYLYNADGQAIAVIDPAGNVTYTFYDADGRVTGTIDGDGNVTAYSYDADGQVLQTTQYATPINPSAWLSSGALTSSYPTSLPVPTSTVNDRTTTSIYNAAGQVVATIDPANNVTVITYDGTGQAVATTRYATPLTSTQRSSLGTPPALVNLKPYLSANANNRATLTIYDADGRAAATIDAQGYVTVTTYNDAGEAIRQTAYATALTSTALSSLGDTPNLAAVQNAIVTSTQDQTTRTYDDGDGRVVATIDADGYLTTTSYDTTTNTTTTTRYATALTSSQLSALTGSESVATLVGLLGTNTASEQSHVTTNADGQVASRTAVDGTVTTYTYNSVGQVLSSTVTPASGQGAARTTSATYDAFGETVTATDAATATTTYVYNALGQHIEATDALGNSTWTYYDANGKLLYTIEGQPSGATRNALGNVSAYQYNAFGEVTSTTTYAGQLTLTTTGTSSGATLNIATATTAQVTAALATPLAAPSGDANAVTLTTYTLDGQVATVTDGNGYQTARSYDAFGDVTQVQQQLSQPGSALTASNSTITTYTYDQRGEQLSETDGVGSSVARTASQTYDAFGRVTSRTDGNGHTISYTYDALGRQITTSLTVQGTARTTQTTYDAFGQVLTETDALGNTTTYSYSVATHTATVTTPGGITTTTVKDALGDTVSVTDGGGNTTTYTYDADGRLLTTTDALGNVSHRQYDADGALIQTTDAAGHVVTTTYNASGKVLTQTVDPSGLNLVTTYAYDGQGRQLSITDPTGAVTTYSYDADGQVLTKVVNAGTGQLNLTTTYSYDGDGKTLTVTQGAGTSAATTTQYVYDNLERLSQTIVNPGTGQLNLTTTYTYDANDNLITQTDANGNVTRYVYDEASEQVFTIDPTGAVTQNTYDTDGHLTATRTITTVLTASQLSALGTTPTIAAVTADLTTSNYDRYTQSVYNADGQVVYRINGIGLNPTQYTYNAAGQVTQTRQYVTALSTSSLSPTATPATVASYLTTSANDLVTTTAYNADGQAVYSIDGAGDVTQTLYDAAGRVTTTIAYATPLTSTQLATLGSTPTLAQVSALITPSANDRASITSYDTAGRVLFTVNAAGAVTQTTYDADGRVTSTHAYATALTSAQLATLGHTPTLAQIAAVLTTTANDAITYTVYDGAGEARYTIDPLGYVSETRYDATGRVIETLAYANAISTTTETSALQAGAAYSWLSGQVGGTTGSNPDSSAEATLMLYDAAGRHAFTVQQNGTVGQVTAYAYDANGNVTSQTVYGNTLTLSTGSSLSAQLTTAGVTTAVASFTTKETTRTVYDADNRALYTIDALNNVTQLSYDGVGRVIETQQYATAITLPGTITASTIAAAVTAAGTTGVRFSTTSYTSRGQVISTADALGTNASYGYNALGQKISYTNRDGAVWTYTYDSAGRLIQTQSPQVTVGGYGNSNPLTNQSLYTTNTYDAFGDLIDVSQGYGASASAISTISTTSYTYDAMGRRIQTTDALNHTTTTTYNALGQAVVAKDANGNLTYTVYDADGRVLDRIDGNGYLTATTYDAYGNVLSTTQYATALNTSAITGWSAGQPLSAAQVQQGLVTSSNDRTTTTTYNQLNQKTQVVLSSIAYDLSMGVLGGNVATGSPTTTYTYDAYGNVTSSSQLVQGALTSGSTTTPAVWATTYTYYDALNRAVMVVTPTGAYTSPQGYVTTTAYNAFGQVTSSTQYAQAISTGSITTTTPPGLPAAATQASGADRTTTTTYDAIGRVSTELDTGGYYTTSGSTTSYTTANVSNAYTYNGENQVLTQTHNGAVTTTTYDALGRVLTVTAPARSVLVGNWQSILESTPTDDLTTAALYTSVSPVTTYVYDALGHAVSTTVAGGGLTQQSYASYNALGQLTQSTDANATSRTFTYDANGNVLTQSYTLTGSTTVTTTNTYDANNQLLSTAVQRSGVSPYDSSTQQKYNAFGEVIAKGDNNGFEATYTYNAAGQQSSAPDSHGALHTYGYDLVGNLVVDRSTVTGGASAVWTHNTYNLSDQVVSQITPATNAAAGENSASVSLSYDRWGNVTAKTDANGNTTTSQYDSQNHLIEQTGANVLVVSASGVYTWTNPIETWAYNVNGELQQQTDANGNATIYSYDAVGNQTVVVDGTGAYTYTSYDALGRAVATQTPPAQTATGTAANISFTAYNNLNQVTDQGYLQFNGQSTPRTPVLQNHYVLDANGDRLVTYDGIGSGYWQKGDTANAAKYTTTYTYDSQHRVLTSTTPLNETTTYVYDVNGNLIHQTDADGYTQSWTYNYFKQVQTHTDESGATYTYTYDANSGLLTKETSNWSPTGPSSSITSTLTFGYEANGGLASLTEAVTSGSSTVTSTYGYSYDANSNEILSTVSTQDGGGNAVSGQTVLTYDSHNRLREATYENSAGNTATMRNVYVYDADGNRRAVFTRSAYGATATPIPLTAGGPTLGTALTAQSVAPGGTSLNYSVVGSFSDSLGMGLTYTASGMPSWLSFNGSTGTFTGAPPVPTAASSYTVTVTAMDALGNSVSGSFTVTVPAVQPVLSSAPTNQTLQPGQALSYQAPAATDANGYAITYSASGLPSGVSFNASTRTFSGTPPAAGNTYTVSYTATPSGGPATTATFTITVSNVAPTFTGSIGTQTVTPGSAWSYQAPTATDANGYGVTYSASGVPSGMTFNASTRTFSGTLNTGGTYTVTYIATATTGGQSASQTFNITVPSPTPVFSSQPANQAATATAGGWSYQAPAASDPAGLSVSYSASGMPSGISFNASTRTFSGTPSAAGTSTITYTATAGNGAVASTTFTLTVNPAPPPVYNGSGDIQLSWGGGGTYTWTVPSTMFTNPMGRSLTYTLSGGVPPYTAMSSAGVLTYNRSNPYAVRAPTSVLPQSAPGGNTYYYPTLTVTDPVDGQSVSVTMSILIAGTVNPAITAAPTTTTTTSNRTAAVMTPAATPASTPAPSPAPNMVANWYTYDADSRVLVTNGSLQNGQIVITSGLNSGENAYDAAGDLAMYTTVNSSNQTTSQKYIYDQLGEKKLIETQTSSGSSFANYQTQTFDADGRLISTITYQLPGSIEAGTYSGSTVSFSDAGWIKSDVIYTYNTDGELIDQSEYDEDGAQDLINQYHTAAAIQSSTYATQDQSVPSSLPSMGSATDGALYLSTDDNYQAFSSGYGYDADGNLLGYRVITGSQPTVVNGSPTAGTTNYQNSYLLQNAALLSKTVQTGSAGNLTNTNTYNDLGVLAQTSGTVNGTSQTNVMAYTADGQVLQKTNTPSGSASNTAVFLYAGQQGLGSVNTDGAINVLATTGGYTNGSLGTQNYTVEAGDTLAVMAWKIYGDSNYAYILAEANGLQVDSPLPVGMVLHIPQVTTTANASSTFQPYAQNGIVNGGATACETTAQIVTASIQSVLNQQSALAQTVAQIEQQQQAAATAQQQAEALQKKLLEDAQAVANAKDQADAADGQAAQALRQAKQVQLQAGEVAQQAELSSASPKPESAQDDLWAREMAGWGQPSKATEAASEVAISAWSHRPSIGVGTAEEARAEGNMSDAAPPPDGLQGEDSDGMALVNDPGGGSTVVIPGYSLATAGAGVGDSGSSGSTSDGSASWWNGDNLGGLLGSNNNLGSWVDASTQQQLGDLSTAYQSDNAQYTSLSAQYSADQSQVDDLSAQYTSDQGQYQSASDTALQLQGQVSASQVQLSQQQSSGDNLPSISSSDYSVSPNVTIQAGALSDVSLTSLSDTSVLTATSEMGSVPSSAGDNDSLEWRAPGYDGTDTTSTAGAKTLGTVTVNSSDAATAETGSDPSSDSSQNGGAGDSGSNAALARPWMLNAYLGSLLNPFSGLQSSTQINESTIGPVPQTLLNNIYNYTQDTASELQPYAPGSAMMYRMGGSVLNGMGNVWASWSALWNKDANGGLEQGVNPFSGTSIMGVDAWNERFNSAATAITSGVGLLEGGIEGAFSSLKSLFTDSVGAVPDTGIYGARGPVSGRPFDPTQAGGPIENLSTDGVQITNDGVDTVVQHLSRFGQDDANDFMIDRLSQIANGNLDPTQVDLNFYTHEIREFQRYSNLGWESGQPSNPDEAYELWNNAHTATLEDYGLRDGQLYHPDAPK